MDTVIDHDQEKQSDTMDFSLVLGGPLYQIFRRAHLSGDMLDLLNRRMIVISAITWLPMMILALIEAGTSQAKPVVSFLQDIETHSRYLIALPVLIYSEYLVNSRMRPIIQQFKERNLILEQSKFEATIQSSLRLRNSILAEVFLIVMVYTVGIFMRRSTALDSTTWYAYVSNGKYNLTWAGLWYAYVALPFFQFILLRWYFRFFIWGRFLYQVAKTKLRLIPTHPDRVAGLGFLGSIAFAFAPILFAHGVLLSGMIANRIFYESAKLPDFKLEIVTMIIILLLLVLTPLLVFAVQLNRTKRTGLREYGILSQRYVTEFDEKWLRNRTDEPLIGSADIQSLADLGNSFQVVREMRLVPFSKDTIIQLAVTSLIPLLPLVLTMFSVEQLLDRFLKTVF